MKSRVKNPISRTKSQHFSEIPEQAFGQFTLGSDTAFGPHVVIGYPKESRVADGLAGGLSSMNLEGSVAPVAIGSNCILGAHSVIGEGAQIGDRVVMDEHSRVGYDCKIGADSRLMYGAFVCDRVVIGSHCKVAGFVCDAVTLRDYVTSMGNLVHEYSQPQVEWGIEEAPPTIEECAVISYGAVVVGGVTVGRNSYVAANAIVTKDVPAQTLVTGTNSHQNHADLRGGKIHSDFWEWTP